MNDLDPTAQTAQVVKSPQEPLYRQIFRLLRDEITSGQRPHGALVPTEKELSRIYGVSRITTRRALDELAHNRLVARKRRVGTRVTFQPVSAPMEGSIEQAMEALLTIGRATKVELVELVEEDCPVPVTDALGLTVTDKVVRAVRVRWLDDQPLGCVISYMPSRLGKQFTREDLETTPIFTLMERAGLKISSAAQTVSACSADSDLAKLLDVERTMPILRIGRTTYDASGQALLFTLGQYRSDRYQIRLDLHSFDGATPTHTAPSVKRGLPRNPAD